MDIPVGSSQFGNGKLPNWELDRLVNYATDDRPDALFRFPRGLAEISGGIAQDRGERDDREPVSSTRYLVQNGRSNGFHRPKEND